MELYGLQQQLAKLQLQLEKTHENCNAINQYRLSVRAVRKRVGNALVALAHSPFTLYNRRHFPRPFFEGRGGGDAPARAGGRQVG